MKYILLSIITFVSTPIFADECLYPHNEPLAIGDDSRRIIQEQARNTWSDWIWRGQTFTCSKTGTVNCSYQWALAQTTGYSWSVGGTLNFDKLPVVGKYMPGNINGSYGRNKSLTTTFTWSVTLQPGYSAEPVQIVVRRWMKGVYRGTFINTGGRCNGVGGGIGIGSPRADRTSMYRWDPNRIATSWSTNAAITTKVMYHVFK